MLIKAAECDYELIVADILSSYRQAVSRWRDEAKIGNAAKADVQYKIDISWGDLSTREIMVIHEFSKSRDRGLLATRRGDLEAAEYHFMIARTPLNKRELTEVSFLLYESFLEQAESFLFCRQSKFDKANISINKSLSNDSELECKYPHLDLTLHRIQLVHNLVRLEVYKGNRNNAVALAAQILAYLAGMSSSLPIIGRWGYQRIEKLPPGKVNAMYVQVANEIAIILAGESRQCKGELLSLLNNISISGNKDYHQIVTEWLVIQRSFACSNTLEFLLQASYFLVNIRLSSVFFISATLIDLVTLCEELHLEITLDVRKEISKDSDLWQQLPSKKISNLLNFSQGIIDKRSFYVQT
jgi:hypothetical protein